MYRKDDAMESTGPLAGVTIIDLSRVLAGPFCTLVLAELGAHVIKVEAPGCGDDSRHFGPFVNGKSAYFMSLNRGKQSIALDLKASEGRSVFERLLEQADVLVENFRPGALERLGYGWDSLHRRYPRLIYAAVSGFGQTGPYAQRPAYDIIAQAMGGLMGLTGHPDGAPTRVGTSIGDIAAGSFLAIGINAALYSRERGGEGIMVDVAMLDGQVAILENAIARYAVTGSVPEPLGARHPSITPFDAFHASDGYLVIAAGNDMLFERLCAALERPDLVQNPLFSSNDLRTQHHAALKDELESVLKLQPVSHWLPALDAAGIPSGPINTVDQVLADPQIAHRNMAVTTDDPTAGRLVLAGNPIKLSGYADPSVRPPAPELDGDRERILASLAKASAGASARGHL
jgi:CoA:oxalate CoA-transferase